MIVRILLFILVCASFRVVGEPVYMQSSTELKVIGKHISFYEDESKLLTIDDILLKQDLFQRNQKNVFASPAKSGATWFKIEIANQTGESLWLGLGGGFSSWYIDVYKPDSSGKHTICTKSGAMREDKNQEYPGNFFWFKLAKSSEKNIKTFFVRYESEQPKEIPFRVGTLYAFNKYKQAHDFLTASFLGVMIAMFIYNLFLFFATKDRNYFYYICLLLFSVFAVLFDNNAFLFNQIWIYEHYIVWHNLVFIFVFLFSDGNLELRKNLPKARIFILSLVIINSFVFPVLNLLGMSLINIINPLQICITIYYLSLLVAGIYLWTKKVSNAKYYVIGWSFSFLSILIFILVINGIVPYTLITRNIMYIGLCIEAVLFSFVLGNRINIMKNEKQNALYELVEVQKKSLKEAKESEEQIKALYSDLSKSYKNLEQFSFIVSHNLRAPLSNIKGLLAIYNTEDIADPDNVALLEHMKTSASNLDEVLQDLNVILNAKKSMLEDKTSVDFNLMFKSICDSIRTEIQETETTFELHVPANLQIYTVKSIFQSVFFNLIQNAIKYKSENRKPHILISITETAQAYHFSLKDNGIGIDLARHQNKVFSLYARFQANIKGKGIGLYLVKTHIEMLGGEINVKSEFGQFTEFHFDIKK